MVTIAPWNPRIRFTIIWPFNPLFELNWTVELEDELDEEEEEDTDVIAAFIARTTPLMASLFCSSTLFLA